MTYFPKFLNFVVRLPVGLWIVHGSSGVVKSRGGPLHTVDEWISFRKSCT